MTWLGCASAHGLMKTIDVGHEVVSLWSGSILIVVIIFIFIFIVIFIVIVIVIVTCHYCALVTCYSLLVTTYSL